MTSAPDELDVVDYIQVTADTYTQLGYGTYLSLIHISEPTRPY